MYRFFLISSGSNSGVDKIPTVDEYENALKGDMDLDKKIVKLGDLNELAYEIKLYPPILAPLLAKLPLD